MSKMEGFIIHDSQNASKTGDIAAARPRSQSMARRKLSDISNLMQNPRPLIQEKPQTTTIEYIDQLRKEKMDFVKMLAQRNKIIEQSGIELDRLRLNLLKMQEQNRQLALSNTQMLAELNSGKDQLKELQHELGCKNGLLKAKLQIEEKAKVRPCKNDNLEGGCQSSKEGRDDEKPRNAKRVLQSNSLGSSEDNQSKDKTESKRPFVRRQSARFKAAELKATEEFKTSGENELPVAPLPETGSTSENATIKNEDNECSSGSQEYGRSSLCRPSRLAAKKVQSYKEVPLNCKMRRSE